MLKRKHIFSIVMTAAISIGVVAVSYAAQNDSTQMAQTTTGQKANPKTLPHKRRHHRRHHARLTKHARRVPKANSLKKLSW